ncbi:MAG: hypothetical protein CMI54_06690 [Parcubacteria group bacterium]|nr:hypothetical protein [Parcubacteria group bacterium]|tara:strand:- start:58255 stop:59961 length:1707 start_codon:yes stop_codon:yes gene_type:complete
MKYWRINLILILIFIFGAAVMARLIFLQIIDHEFYSALAKGQQKVFARELGDRGDIFSQDKNDNLYKLATNKEWSLVYISPKEQSFSPKELKETSAILGQILNISEDIILEKFKKDSLYELIKTKLTDKEVDDLEGVNLAGVYLRIETGRYYPQEDFLSQVVGFLGGGGDGQYGIEEYWDKVLKGETLTLEGEKGPGGFFFFNQEASSGADLVLTIDYNVQYQAEKLLKNAKKNLDIERGQIIVMDPSSGEIISLANFPNFDPNEYEDYALKGNLEIFQNGAIQKIFEPGSVFKAITTAAALNENKIDHQMTYIDQGKVKIGGYTIYNYDERVWGERTMTEVLERSINTGAVFIQSKIAHSVFLNYIERFGIFNKTGIDLPGEVFSQNEELKKGYEINFATASFGQGIDMTPLGLVRAYSVIANDGKLVVPYIVEKITKDDKIIETNQPQISKERVISSETSSKLSAMLVSVVENGFTKSARIPGYYIAGKTGTSQISWSALGVKKSGYSEKTIQSFIGFFPAFNPQFLILVKLDDPETKTAEYSAVPVFQELAKYIIDYYQIPPDYE